MRRPEPAVRPRPGPAAAVRSWHDPYVPEPPSTPDRRTVLAGKAICALVAHLPWAWPMVSRPVMRFFDRAARGWDDRTGAGSPEHLEALATAVLEVGRAPERILDLGCGTGAGTLFLSREFPRASVRGVDLSPEMVALAAAKVGLDPEGRVAFRQADAARLPFADESFDLVTQVNMPVFFAEIGRVLRPGGSVVIAHSLGPDPPFSPPEGPLRRRFSRRGVIATAAGRAGRGTWFVGQKGVSAR